MDPMKKLKKSLYCESQAKRNLIYSKFGKKLVTLRGSRLSDCQK